MMEQEHNQRLLKSRVQVPDKIEVDGAMRIPCHLYPECKTVFIKALGRFSIWKPLSQLEYNRSFWLYSDVSIATENHYEIFMSIEYIMRI